MKSFENTVNVEWDIGKAEQSIRSTSSPTKNLVNSMNLASIEILANKNDSNSFVSTLMISILTVLICFIFGLIAFIFIYVRKCKNNQRKAIKSKSLMSTINSRRDYTGATLTDSSASSLQADSFEKKFNLKSILDSNTLSHNQTLNCCNCDTLIKLSNNDHFQNHSGLVTINNRLQSQQMTLANQKYYQITSYNQNEKCSTKTCANPNICNCLQLGSSGKCNFSQPLTLGDTSTVSSTLSSVKQTDKLTNELETSPNQHNPINHEHTSWNFCSNPNQVISATSSDMSSSPTSFTHFIIPQNNTNANHHQVPIGYIPYELYNCIQNSSNTLILPSVQQQIMPFITNSSNTNSKKLTTYEKSKIISNQANLINMNSLINQINANNDHVYCEIPTTINRYMNNNQQNSSTSLLLSSSSSSSSTSPKANSITAHQTNNINKYIPPSII